ncbi:MAG: P27 family phage terminase small subunit [Solirubrobacteraceae bacterium]
MAVPKRFSSAPRQVPAQARKVPTPPRDLDANGRHLWKTVWGLSRVELSDRASVLRLCRLEGEAAELRQLIRESGILLERPIQSATGKVVGTERYSNPACGELRKIGREAAVICDSLGLNPASRAKMGLAPLTEPGEPDAIDELVAKRNARLSRPALPGEGSPGTLEVKSR